MTRFLAIAALVAASGFSTAPAWAESVAFQAPSGNIFCFGINEPGEVWVRCDILQVNTTSFPNPPPDCDLDWGHAFYLEPSRAGTPICAGDTVADTGAPVLNYGQQRQIGNDLVCYSEKTGMECQNNRGNGFQLRRAGQTVY
jgi:hypothetical protein